MKPKYKKYKLISDGRTLRRFINHGFIKEAKYAFYPYIDADISEFTCNRGGKYIVKYIDGSFYPLVYKVISRFEDCL